MEEDFRRQKYQDLVERKLLEQLPGPGQVQSLCDLGQPLMKMGFTETEIVRALVALTHARTIQLLPGRQLRVLKHSV
ncbi:hypothetical protein RGCCGE502_22625 [Rhizobium grahamii CCGE 502]|uniref:Uncharacterized protein n=1 Tax=Rhizobium grahamii CCGE 502 TaxID=990285 RepID=S3I8N0_9HYPH|nr:hypothetical protein RGCCGE502_22625 [Rhizobium grahamii CCGE 502]